MALSSIMCLFLPPNLHLLLLLNRLPPLTRTTRPLSSRMLLRLPFLHRPLRLHPHRLPFPTVLLLHHLKHGISLSSPGIFLQPRLRLPLHLLLCRHLPSHSVQCTCQHRGLMLHLPAPICILTLYLKVLRLSLHPTPTVLPAFRQHVPLRQHRLWFLLPSISSPVLAFQ